MQTLAYIFRQSNWQFETCNIIPTVRIPDLPELTNSKTQDHGHHATKYLACLTDGVGVDTGIMESLSVTRQPVVADNLLH